MGLAGLRLCARLLRAWRLGALLGHRLNVFRLDGGGVAALAIDALLTLDVPLVLLEFFVLLTTHVVNTFVGVLRHLI